MDTPVVDAPTFSEWGWTLRDPQKRALADSVRASRATFDERYLAEARSSALQIVADNPNYGEFLSKASASAGPDDWPMRMPKPGTGKPPMTSRCL